MVRVPTDDYAKGDQLPVGRVFHSPSNNTTATFCRFFPESQARKPANACTFGWLDSDPLDAAEVQYLPAVSVHENISSKYEKIAYIKIEVFFCSRYKKKAPKRPPPPASRAILGRGLSWEAVAYGLVARGTYKAPPLEGTWDISFT